MLENTIQDASIIGCSLLIFNIVVMARTSTASLDMTEPHSEEENIALFGKAAANPFMHLIITVVNSIAPLWLPIYIGIHDGVWTGIISFFSMLFIAPLIGKMIVSDKYFSTALLISFMTGLSGYVLTVITLFE